MSVLSAFFVALCYVFDRGDKLEIIGSLLREFLLLGVDYLSTGQTDNNGQQESQPEIKPQKDGVSYSCCLFHIATFNKTSSWGKSAPEAALP
jgi:hypothetical protein